MDPWVRKILLEKAMATHSSALAWKIPWTEEPGGLQSVGSLSWTWLSDFTFTFRFHALEKGMATHSSVLAWRIPEMREPGGLPSMGSHRVGYDWSDLATTTQSCWRLFSICCFSPNSAMAPLKSVHLLEVPDWQEKKTPCNAPYIVFPFSSISFYLMHFDVLWLGTYTFWILSLCNMHLLSLCNDVHYVHNDT